eukprot:4493404-Amphidinium_carterae.1
MSIDEKGRKRYYFDTEEMGRTEMTASTRCGTRSYHEVFYLEHRLGRSSTFGEDEFEKAKELVAQFGWGLSGHDAKGPQ